MFCKKISFLSVLLFFPNVSIGESHPSQSNVSVGESYFSRSNVEYLPPRKAENSLVLVAGHDGRGHRLWEELGWIAKDVQGNVGVVASFRVIDRSLYKNTSRFSIGVYAYPGVFFAVKELKRISPIENLMFLTFQRDITENGKRVPLRLAETSPRETDPLFYAFRRNSLRPNQSWFEMKKVKRAVFLSGRQDFLLDTNIKEIHAADPISSLVMNQRGEVVSFASRSAEDILFGTPLNYLKGFLSESSESSDSLENCSIVFLKGCVMKARRKLYRSASKDSRASRELSYMSESRFEQFMQSIGISDLSLITKKRRRVS